MEWKVKPEDRPKFEGAVYKWHLLAKCIGWDALADMYVRRVPPFQDVKKIRGNRKQQKARDILICMVAKDLKENGLEVS